VISEVDGKEWRVSTSTTCDRVVSNLQDPASRIIADNITICMTDRNGNVCHSFLFGKNFKYKITVARHPSNRSATKLTASRKNIVFHSNKPSVVSFQQVQLPENAQDRSGSYVLRFSVTDEKWKSAVFPFVFENGNSKLFHLYVLFSLVKPVCVTPALWIRISDCSKVTGSQSAGK